MKVYVVYGEWGACDYPEYMPEDLAMVMGVFQEKRKAEKLQENCYEMYGDYEFYISEEVLR